MNHGMKPPGPVAQLTLSESLLRRAHPLTPDLNAQVDTLLAAWVRADVKRQAQPWAEASDAWVAKHGIPGAEHSPI
jgi:hypothetical protein